MTSLFERARTYAGRRINQIFTFSDSYQLLWGYTVAIAAANAVLSAVPRHERRLRG
jgi:hypothetical protein